MSPLGEGETKYSSSPTHPGSGHFSVRLFADGGLWFRGSFMGRHTVVWHEARRGLDASPPAVP